MNNNAQKIDGSRGLLFSDRVVRAYQCLFGEVTFPEDLKEVRKQMKYIWRKYAACRKQNNYKARVCSWLN